MATIEELRPLLAGTTLPPELVTSLLDGAPPLWLSSDGAGALACDLALCHPELKPGEVRAMATSAQDHWRLTVVAHDRLGLLADTTAVVGDVGLSIAGAAVATWAELGLAMHALTLLGRPPADAVMERLGANLRAAGEGEPAPTGFRPQGRASVRHTGVANGDPIVTVQAADQPGLLSAVCRWFADHGASIQAAWIDGDDREAHDLFVVRGLTDIDGLEAALSEPGSRPWPEELLTSALGTAERSLRCIADRALALLHPR